MADPTRQPGWREALLVGAAVVLAVLVAAALTDVVPGLADLVHGAPITIVVLVAGTAVVLWRIAARPPAE